MLGLLAAAALALTSSAAAAQGARLAGTTSLRYLELRPMVDDSVRADSVAGGGFLRETSAGVVAYCRADDAWCRYRRTQDDAIGALPLVQDLEASVWGLGRGIHGHAHLRARTTAGEARDLWPQGDDPFDLLAAYVEIERADVRARLGRQWRGSGFGMASFDGAFVSWRAPVQGGALAVDGWAGRSLLQGLAAPRSSGALASFEELAPKRDGILLGTELRWQPRAGRGASVAYQRELRTDGSWLYSERVAADASMRLGRRGSLDAALEYDLGAGWTNEARLGGQLSLLRDLAANAEVRRYRPFYELWTIWGAFSPVGYREASGGLTWDRAQQRLTVGVDAGYRRYDETDEGIDALPMKEDGWRLGLDAQWRPRTPVVLHAAWRTEIGFGASRTDVDGGARWQRDDDAWLGLRASSFQSAFEFRVGTGRVLGLGLDGGMRLRDDLRLAGDVALYRHTYRDLAPATNWGQRRASLRLEWTMGGDPGLAAPNAWNDR